MKNTTIIIALCLVIGFAAGWLAKPAKETSSDDNTQTAAARPASRSTSSSSAPSKSSSDPHQSRPAQRSGVTVKRISSDDDMDPETKKAIEESQRRQNEMMRKRYADKFDMRIAAMVKELGLNAAQEKALRSFFDEQLKKIDMSAMTAFTGNSDSDKVKEMAAALRGDGLNEFMKNHLSEDQMEGLEALQERKKNSKVESRALKDLAKLQQTLDLSDDQKDKVYNLLIEDAEKRLASQSDADFLTRSMMSSMGVEMDLGDMDMGSVMNLHAEGDDAPKDRAALIQKMKDDRQKRIDDKVARLAPVLNETQQQQYRKSLENKGGMFQMMIQGAEAEEIEVETK